MKPIRDILAIIDQQDVDTLTEIVIDAYRAAAALRLEAWRSGDPDAYDNAGGWCDRVCLLMGTLKHHGYEIPLPSEITDA